MEITIAHIAPDCWIIALYLPSEGRVLDGPMTLHSALTTREIIVRWQGRGARVRPGSQGMYRELVAECEELRQLVVGG